MPTARRRVVLVLLCGGLWAGGCVGFGNGSPTPQVRSLDSMCQGDACTTMGSTRKTSGPTADSIGYRLGPGLGTLDIPVDSGIAGLSVLVRGSGHFHATLSDCTGCPRLSYAVGADYAWVDLIAHDAGSAQSYDAGLSSYPGIELSVDDDGSHVDLADVRSVPDWSCSVVAGPR